MGNKNIIELNGKRYDSSTGQLLGVSTIPHTVSSIKVQVKGHSGRTLDVFSPPNAANIKRRLATKVLGSHAKPSSIRVQIKSKDTSEKLVSSTGLAKPLRPPAPQIHAHKPEGARTLVRSAVKKPTLGFKKQIVVQTSLASKVPSLIVHKSSIQSINPLRTERAKSIPRSPKVNHYSQAIPNFSARVVAPLPVKPVPPTDTAAPKPQPNNKPSTASDIFEHAIASADHYADLAASKLHFKKKARQHFVSIAAGGLALIILGGFLAYQNVPDVQLNVAAIRAGIHTGMPNFQAAGFAFKDAKIQNGKLSIGFSGHGGNYELTQQKTNWSASDMIQAVAATDSSGAPDYTTLQANGKTIYRFSNNSATWINGGKWYQLNGTGALSDYQVKTLTANI